MRLEIFLAEFSSNFHQTIVDGYKDDSQFSKVLVAGVESGIYVLRNGLLYLAMPGVHRLCIPNTKVERGRGKEKGKEVCVRCLWHMLTRLLVIWVWAKVTSHWKQM